MSCLLSTCSYPHSDTLSLFVDSRTKVTKNGVTITLKTTSVRSIDLGSPSRGRHGLVVERTYANQGVKGFIPELPFTLKPGKIVKQGGNLHM